MHINIQLAGLFALAASALAAPTSPSQTTKVVEPAYTCMDMGYETVCSWLPTPSSELEPRKEKTEEEKMKLSKIHKESDLEKDKDDKLKRSVHNEGTSVDEGLTVMIKRDRGDEFSINAAGQCLPSHTKICDKKNDLTTCHCDYKEDDGCAFGESLLCHGWADFDCGCVSSIPNQRPPKRTVSPANNTDDTLDKRGLCEKPYTMSVTGQCLQNSLLQCDDYSKEKTCECVYNYNDGCGPDAHRICTGFKMQDCTCVYKNIDKVKRDEVLELDMSAIEFVPDAKLNKPLTADGQCIEGWKKKCGFFGVPNACACLEENDECFVFDNCTMPGRRSKKDDKRSIPGAGKTISINPVSACPDKSKKICDDNSDPNNCVCVFEDDGCADGEARMCNVDGEDCQCVSSSVFRRTVPGAGKTISTDPASACPDKSKKICDDNSDPNDCVCVFNDDGCPDGEEIMCNVDGNDCQCIGPLASIIKRTNIAALAASGEVTSNTPVETSEELKTLILNAAMDHIDAHAEGNSDVAARDNSPEVVKMAKLQLALAAIVDNGGVVDLQNNNITYPEELKGKQGKIIGLPSADKDEAEEEGSSEIIESSSTAVSVANSQNPNSASSPSSSLHRLFRRRKPIWAPYLPRPLGFRPEAGRKPLTPEQVNYKREQFADCERRKGTRRCSIEWEEFESRVDQWRAMWRTQGRDGVLATYNAKFVDCINKNDEKWCIEHEYDTDVGGLGPGTICGNTPMLFYCATGRVLPKNRQHMPRLPGFMYDAMGHRWDQPWRNETMNTTTAVVDLPRPKDMLLHELLGTPATEAPRPKNTPSKPKITPSKQLLGTPPLTERSEHEELPLEHNFLDIIHEIDPDTAILLKRWLHYRPQNSLNYEIADDIDEIEFQMRPPRLAKRIDIASNPDPEMALHEARCRATGNTWISNGGFPHCESESIRLQLEKQYCHQHGLKWVVRPQYTACLDPTPEELLENLEKLCTDAGLAWITDSGPPHCNGSWPLDEDAEDEGRHVVLAISPEEILGADVSMCRIYGDCDEKEGMDNRPAIEHGGYDYRELGASCLEKNLTWVTGEFPYCENRTEGGELGEGNAELEEEAKRLCLFQGMTWVITYGRPHCENRTKWTRPNDSSNGASLVKLPNIYEEHQRIRCLERNLTWTSDPFPHCENNINISLVDRSTTIEEQEKFCLGRTLTWVTDPFPHCVNNAEATTLSQRSMVRPPTFAEQKKICWDRGLTWVTGPWPHCEQRPDEFRTIVDYSDENAESTQDDALARRSMVRPPTFTEQRKICWDRGLTWVTGPWPHCEQRTDEFRTMVDYSDEKVSTVDSSDESPSTDTASLTLVPRGRSMNEQRYHDMMVRCSRFNGLWVPHPIFSRDRTRRPYCRNPLLPHGRDKIVMVIPDEIPTINSDAQQCLAKGYYWHAVNQTCYLQHDGSSEWKDAPAGWNISGPGDHEKRGETKPIIIRPVQDPNKVTATSADEMNCKVRGFWWSEEKGNCSLQSNEEVVAPSFWRDDFFAADPNEEAAVAMEAKPWDWIGKVQTWVEDTVLSCDDCDEKRRVKRGEVKNVEVRTSAWFSAWTEPLKRQVQDQLPVCECDAPKRWYIPCITGPCNDDEEKKQETTSAPAKPAWDTEAARQSMCNNQNLQWSPKTRTCEAKDVSPIDTAGQSTLLIPELKRWLKRGLDKVFEATSSITLPIYFEYYKGPKPEMSDFPTNNTHDSDNKPSVSSECKSEGLWRECLKTKCDGIHICTSKDYGCVMWSPCMDRSFRGPPLYAPSEAMESEDVLGRVVDVEPKSFDLPPLRTTEHQSGRVRGLERRGNEVSHLWPQEAAFVEREDWMKKRSTEYEEDKH